MENKALEALALIHEQMCEELKEMHIRWVNQNWRLRGIELAKTQIQSKGDINVGYAMEALKKEHDRLGAINERTSTEMYNYRSFIAKFERKVEDVTGEKLDSKKLDAAMSAIDKSGPF